jgi:hypothetical protein
MRIPLHLPPLDYSTAACRQRVALYERMAALNPKGFRTPSHKTNKKRVVTRFDTIVKLAALDGKAEFLEAVVPAK